MSHASYRIWPDVSVVCTTVRTLISTVVINKLNCNFNEVTVPGRRLNLPQRLTILLLQTRAGIFAKCKGSKAFLMSEQPHCLAHGTYQLLPRVRLKATFKLCSLHAIWQPMSVFRMGWVNTGRVQYWQTHGSCSFLLVLLQSTCTIIGAIRTRFPETCNSPDCEYHKMGENGLFCSEHL